jgi:hypothetical protein
MVTLARDAFVVPVLCFGQLWLCVPSVHIACKDHWQDASHVLLGEAYCQGPDVSCRAVFEKFDFRRVSVEVEIAGVIEEVGALTNLRFFILRLTVEGLASMEDLTFSISSNCWKLQLASKSVQYVQLSSSAAMMRVSRLLGGT